ncbi:MAG: copper-binding protein [Opitutaceae bacterium]|nr:copper-binding protein [Opitutaceae bacterium]
MKALSLLFVSFTVAVLPAASAAAEKHGGCTCGSTKSVSAASTSTVSHDHAAPAAGATPAEAPKRHPLKGVVVEVLVEKGALIVRHEEIPGVMKAMTMSLKVDAPTLTAVKAGQAITGLLVRKDTGWWLEDVAVVSRP